jgi:hypothetical protein
VRAKAETARALESLPAVGAVALSGELSVEQLELVGNPNQPDGMRMVHLDDLTAEEADQGGLPKSKRRPRPDAA